MDVWVEGKVVTEGAKRGTERSVIELAVVVLGCRKDHVLGPIVADLAVQTGANLVGEEGTHVWLEQKVVA